MRTQFTHKHMPCLTMYVENRTFDNGGSTTSVATFLSCQMPLKKSLNVIRMSGPHCC